MAPPFRADHVGSLLRPPSLLEARQAVTEDPNSTSAKEGLDKAEKTAIASVIQEQLNRNVTPITSGEYEREIFYDDFFNALPGFDVVYKEWPSFRSGFPTNRPLLEWGDKGRYVAVASDKIQYAKSPFLADWEYIRGLLPKERWGDYKITLPSPTWFHMQLRDGESYDTGVYKSDDEFFADVIMVMRAEIMTLYDAGLRFIQIDDPNLTFFCDEEWIAEATQAGENLDALLEMYIRVHNAVISNLPSDLRLGIHLCRGNFPNGIHLGSGSYTRIAAKLFRELNYSLFYLEFDSPRAGNFEPLQYLPVDKAVVLGVVTTKFSAIEDLEALKQRVLSAAEIIAAGQGGGRTTQDALRDNLAVSPQCGFASAAVAGGQGVDMEVMWKKLDLVKRLADECFKGL